MKTREGDKDMMQVMSPENVKNGRVSPLSTLLPRVQNICSGSGIFEAQILELMKDIMLRSSTNSLFLQCLLRLFIQGFWDMLRQNGDLAHYPHES